MASSRKPMSSVSTRAISSLCSSMRSASRCITRARSLAAREPHIRKPSSAAETAALAVDSSPLAMSASFIASQSSGERVSNVSADADHSPPIRCPVGTWTPATSARTSLIGHSPTAGRRSLASRPCHRVRSGPDGGARGHRVADSAMVAAEYVGASMGEPRTLAVFGVDQHEARAGGCSHLGCAVSSARLRVWALGSRSRLRARCP